MVAKKIYAPLELMDRTQRGVPLGDKPQMLTGEGIVSMDRIALRMITRTADFEGRMCLHYWSWYKDYRYKSVEKGTWYGHCSELSQKGLHDILSFCTEGTTLKEIANVKVVPVEIG